MHKQYQSMLCQAEQARDSQVTMRNNRAKFILLGLCVLLQACATPYYGHTEEEWALMSAHERQAAQEHYQDILELQREQARKDAHDLRTHSIIEKGVGGPLYQP